MQNKTAFGRLRPRVGGGLGYGGCHYLLDQELFVLGTVLGTYLAGNECLVALDDNGCNGMDMFIPKHIQQPQVLQGCTVDSYENKNLVTIMPF